MTELIELRQNKSHVLNNGDYITNFKNKIEIKQGDTVRLHKCFIDTLPLDETTFNIENDLDLYFNFYIYQTLNQYIWDNYTPAEPIKGVKTTKEVILDMTAERLVLCEKILYNTSTPLDFLSGITRKMNGYQSLSPAWYKIEYENYDGKLAQYRYVYFPEQTEDLTLSVNITCKSGEYKLTRIEGETNGIVSISKQTFESSLHNKYVYIPFQFEEIKTLPKGIYDMNELSIVLNNLVQNSEAKFGKNYETIMKNNFLQTTNKIFDDNPGKDFAFVLSTGEYPCPLEIVADANVLFIGASQMEFGNNDNSFSSQFQIEYIHTPLIDATSKQNVVSIYKNNGSPPSDYEYVAVNNNSGIVFTDLYAIDKITNKPVNFFNDSLNLRTDKLTNLHTVFETQTYTFNSVDYVYGYYNLDLVPGVNITEGFMGLSTFINRNNTNPYLVTSIANNTYSNSTSQYTTYISGDEVSKLASSIKFGYFLIEFDMKLTTKYMDTDEINRNVKGVVERYYSTGNYTYASGEGGITYTHKEEQPIYLSSIHARILNNEKQLVDNLGDDNTIFIQIIRAN